MPLGQADDEDTSADLVVGPRPDRAASPRTRTRADPSVAAENAKWVHDLTTEGADYEAAVTELYRILVKIAHTEVKRRGASLRLSGPELDDIAHQAAADATLTICRKVRTFRGDCRFTTWAYRFVSFDVSSKVKRHCWQRAAPPIDDSVWALLTSSSADAPETQVEGRDLAAAIRRVFREDLTDRQQRAFEAIAVRGIPIQQVADDLGSNPNAVYKTMFDARRKLRQALVSAGYLNDNCA